MGIASDYRANLILGEILYSTHMRIAKPVAAIN